MYLEKQNETIIYVMENYLDNLSALDLKVYQFMIKMTDENNKCFPSEDYISKKLNISERSIIRTIKKLKELKLITVETYSFKGNEYKTKNIYTFIPKKNNSLQIKNNNKEKDIQVSVTNLSPNKYTKDNWYIGLDDYEYPEDRFLSHCTKEETEQIKIHHCKHYKQTHSDKDIFMINACNRKLTELYKESLNDCEDNLYIECDEEYISCSEKNNNKEKDIQVSVTNLSPNEDDEKLDDNDIDILEKWMNETFVTRQE